MKKIFVITISMISLLLTDHTFAETRLLSKKHSSSSSSECPGPLGKRGSQGNRGHRGIRGRPGVAGFVGPQGPAGAPGISPIVLNTPTFFAYVFDTVGTVRPAGAPILNGATVSTPATSVFTFDSLTGILTVNIAGTYLVSYGAGVNTDTSIGVSIANVFDTRNPPVIIQIPGQDPITGYGTYITTVNVGDELVLQSTDSVNGISLFSLDDPVKSPYSTVAAYLEVIKLQ